MSSKVTKSNIQFQEGFRNASRKDQLINEQRKKL